MGNTHKLDRIFVEGFKSIKRLDLPVFNLNILIGPNGAGKSNFIGLFKFIRYIIEERLQVYTGENGGANKILYYGSKVTPRLSVSLNFPPNYYNFNLLPNAADRFIFENEQCYFEYDYNSYKGTKIENINSGGLESELENYNKKRKYGVGKYVYDILKSWRVYHFHDTSKNARVKLFGDIYDVDFLREDAANLAAFLWQMQRQQETHYERIVKTIQQVIPFFKGFVFRPNPHNSATIRLEWQDKYSDIIFDGNDLSDGSIRFICLATLLLQPELPGVILLDEPELGLHPSAITVLAGLLKKASIRSQVIVSTQSVNLVNEFNPEDIVVVDRKESESIFHRLEEESLQQWLEEYALGDLWEKNIIGGKP